MCALSLVAWAVTMHTGDRAEAPQVVKTSRRTKRKQIVHPSAGNVVYRNTDTRWGAKLHFVACLAGLLRRNLCYNKALRKGGLADARFPEPDSKLRAVWPSERVSDILLLKCGKWLNSAARGNLTQPLTLLVACPSWFINALCSLFHELKYT